MKILITIIILLPWVAFGGSSENAPFIPLVGIPGLQTSDGKMISMEVYINALYGLAISLAGLIAVVKIVLAGAKYMLTDLIPAKSDAKEDIKNALIGLLIVLGAWLILTTINSDLTNMTLVANNLETNNNLNNLVSDLSPEERAAAIIKHAEEAKDAGYAFVYSDCEALIEKYADKDHTDCKSICGVIGALANDPTDSHYVGKCYQRTDTSALCDPQASKVCCAKIRQATWDDVNGGCSGFEAGEEKLKQYCYSEVDGPDKNLISFGNSGVWDDNLGVCKNEACSPSTDSYCCTLTHKGIVADDGSCLTGTAATKYSCLDGGKYWGEDNKCHDTAPTRTPLPSGSRNAYLMALKTIIGNSRDISSATTEEKTQACINTGSEFNKYDPAADNCYKTNY